MSAASSRRAADSKRVMSPYGRAISIALQAAHECLGSPDHRAPELKRTALALLEHAQSQASLRSKNSTTAARIGSASVSIAASIPHRHMRRPRTGRVDAGA